MVKLMNKIDNKIWNSGKSNKCIRAIYNIMQIINEISNIIPINHELNKKNTDQ